MGSHVPIEIVEEDGFDWEAAVREIDLACMRRTSNASSSSTHFAPSAHPPITKDNGTKPPSSKRQSTLDRFIGRTEHEHPSPPENQVVFDEFDCGNEKSPCVGIDPETAKTWIYPVSVNVPLRDYQFAITKTALFSNTLVTVPTGLGKTLIAAVVMYNYFRWFPEGKIVFAAPSRPLVLQQIEACHNIVGIPQEWTIDLTGQTCPSKRACFWKSKRVFFVTPQVLEKDIQSGTCLTNYLVCLVIDEAHRALGNYSYCVVVRELMAVPVQLRILALTATPGSKTQAIQSIIDNLLISTLEYRNESDHDVCPYVHDRKVELIEVPMGQDADEVSKCLLDVIRPYAVRLKKFGVNLSRDYQTLSPHEVLMARDKFREAPLPDVPHVNHCNVELCFSALITLYHIRKLLSSHGIRPAYEMLEEKLQQGPFARLMSKNEDIRKTKLLMHQRLSNGAPSPKLSKMLEILVDHFKVKDPRTSRVIIFSNFRGSVRDIMDALSNIRNVVKATEFIGQSSGKTLKGQSQKVQQAVLEKFRAGRFNVIVATSIGEEGLDIMEVDLVICFDANVSPLRMIQRMGRTGRKNNGRVVVLACEGSEKNSYMRKQANGRAIKNHMRNGGTNSFNFHPSPRMIPHVYKPEVQHVEFSIKQFIPRGKKQEQHPTETPAFKKKLTPEEIDLLANYYKPNEEKWKVSLIAFPHFQTLPSKVHKVMHSRQTGMLIDAMQHMQEATFSEQSKSFFTEFGALLGKREEFDTGLMVRDDPQDEEECEELELSPRLTYFIKSGIVPDSPVYDQGVAKEVNKDKDLRFSNELAEEPSSPQTNVQHKRSEYLITSTTNEFITPRKEEALANGTECLAISPFPREWRTPNSSASKDWQMNSGEKSETRPQSRKLKRLRRLGDFLSGIKENNPSTAKADHIRSRTRNEKHIRGKTKSNVDDARVFIDVEAAVSSEAEMSADEKEDLTGDSFEDSFIDDRTMPTANTQAECGKVDMMAVYRRSLLSQSPLPARFHELAASSVNSYSAGPLKTINESRSNSDKSLSSLRTPQTNSESNHDTMVTGDFSVVQISEESQKRKFSLCNSGNVPVVNLENKFAAQAYAMEKKCHEDDDVLEHDHVRSNAGALEYNVDGDDDDAFYATLDFDAVEAHATLLLSKQRSEGKKKEEAQVFTHPDNQKSDGVEKDAPSFDLGLW